MVCKNLIIVHENPPKDCLGTVDKGSEEDNVKKKKDNIISV